MERDDKVMKTMIDPFYDEAFLAERTLFIRTLLGGSDKVNREYAEMTVKNFPECRELYEEIKKLLSYGDKMIQMHGLSSDLRKRLAGESYFEHDDVLEKKLKHLLNEQLDEFQDHQEIFRHLNSILKKL